jgi:UDP-glucose 4-epimerase
MKICVTGGAGYIGANAARALETAGHETVIIDDLSRGYLESTSKRAKFYLCDITSGVEFAKIISAEEKIKPFDCIMHFAAKIDANESAIDPNIYYKNNVEATRITLEIIVEHRIKNLIFSSSAAVYGECEDGVCYEESRTKPTNPYGETKLVCEKMIDYFASAHELNYCIFRYFNVAGVNEKFQIGQLSKPLVSLIPVALQSAIDEKPLTIFGSDYETLDGTCVRDFIHIDDLCSAHLLALNYITTKNAREIVNLGSNNGFSVKEIVKEIQKLRALKIIYGDRRKGDISISISSIQKARKLFGWKPKRSLEDMIKSELVFRIKQNLPNSSL